MNIKTPSTSSSSTVQLQQPQQSPQLNSSTKPWPRLKLKSRLKSQWHQPSQPHQTSLRNLPKPWPRPKPKSKLKLELTLKPKPRFQPNRHKKRTPLALSHRLKLRHLFKKFWQSPRPGWTQTTDPCPPHNSDSSNGRNSQSLRNERSHSPADSNHSNSISISISNSDRNNDPFRQSPRVCSPEFWDIQERFLNEALDQLEQRLAEEARREELMQAQYLSQARADLEQSRRSPRL